jgi:predicted dehydrogenase/nucleoside-diphosphate-sugar epimerase
MRVAIVGCGKISREHIRAVQEMEGLEICAVCDRDKWRAQDIADLVGSANAYGDLASLLKRENPAAAHILTPPQTHAELAIQAMEAGCHVLVEKPMALSVQQADRMIASARENQVKLCANHNYLFKPSVLKASRLVESNAIGQIVYVHSYYALSGEGGSYSHSAGRYHWAWRLPGGVFTNFLPHLIYLQMLFLKDVDSVQGVTLAPAGGGESRATEMTVLLQGVGACGAMSISMRAKPYAKFVDVYGTEGIIHADLVREICTIHRNVRLPRMLSKALFGLEDSIQLASGTAASTVKVGLGRLKNMPGLRRLVREFYASILHDQESPVPGEEAREVTRLMEMVWRKSASEPARIVPTSSVSMSPVSQTDAERSIVERGGMPGRVLVTGATGFLGHRLVSAVSRCGTEVVALVRDKKQVSPELGRQAKLVSGDLRDPASVEAALKDVAVVYHCAAITTNTAPWRAHFETNVRGTEIVLSGAAKAGVQRVVHVSSVVVYGLDRPKRDGFVDESAAYARNPDKWAYYMRSKIEAEELAFKYWREVGLPVTILRLGILYGPGGGREVGRGLAQLGPVRLVIGKGGNALPFTYVDNAVDCLLLAAVSPQAIGQAYNVVDEPQISVRDVVLDSMRITGEQSTLIPLPPLLLSAVARLLELRSSLNGSEVPPRLSRYVVRSACRDIRYDTTKARDQLGWEPALGLTEGMRRTLGGTDIVR